MAILVCCIFVQKDWHGSWHWKLTLKVRFWPVIDCTNVAMQQKCGCCFQKFKLTKIIIMSCRNVKVNFSKTNKVFLFTCDRWHESEWTDRWCSKRDSLVDLDLEKRWKFVSFKEILFWLFVKNNFWLKTFSMISGIHLQKLLEFPTLWYVLGNMYLWKVPR